ncbi:MAG TPA: hypothetical protein VEP73_07610 [Actinomycetota bacterium]|nr:hypothetical protein [Actinomycetota bacterium]
MLASVLRDAARQYRRRPLAAAPSLVVGGASVALQWAPGPVRDPGAIVVVVVGVLAELFQIAYLAGALASGGSGAVEPGGGGAAAAVAAARRSAGPGLRAALLLFAYLAIAYMVALLLLGTRDVTTLTGRQETAFQVGVGPLLAVAFAFLAVLSQGIVLGGERRARLAAVASHRVAAVHFPICLVIGLVQALAWVLGGFSPGVAAQLAITVCLGLVDPLRIAASNSLFLATRSLHAAEPVRPPRR